MRLHPVLRTFATVVGFAAVTATATLAFVSPRTTFADDAEDIGTTDATRLGHVLVRAQIRREAAVKSGWVLAIDASNEGDAAEKCELKTALERSYITPMARVSNEVTTLLTRVETIDVPAHGKARVVREVPAWIAQQLVTGERMQKAREAEMKRAEKDPTATYSKIMAAPYPDFRVAVLEPNAPVAHYRREGGMMDMMPRPLPTPYVPPPEPAASAGFIAKQASPGSLTTL